MTLPSRRHFLVSAGVGVGVVAAGTATSANASAATPALAATPHATSGRAAPGTLCYVKNDHTLTVLVGDREVDVHDASIIAAIHAATQGA